MHRAKLMRAFPSPRWGRDHADCGLGRHGLKGSWITARKTTRDDPPATVACIRHATMARGGATGWNALALRPHSPALSRRTVQQSAQVLGTCPPAPLAGAKQRNATQTVASGGSERMLRACLCARVRVSLFVCLRAAGRVGPTWKPLDGACSLLHDCAR